MRQVATRRQTPGARAKLGKHLLAGAFTAAALLFSVQSGWAQQPSESTQPTDALEQAGSTHSGTVVSIRGRNLTATIDGKDQHSHRISDETKVTIDGRPAQIEDLREGDRIQVTMGEDNVALTIKATRKQAEAPPETDSAQDQGPPSEQAPPLATEGQDQDQPRGRQQQQQQPFLGVQIAPARTAGALVIAVQPGSPADDAGVEEGDVIVSIDEQQVSTPDELRRILRQKNVDDQVNLMVQRGEQEQELNATLAGRQMTGYRGQRQRPEGAPQTFGQDTAWLGVVMHDESPQEQGVIIRRVHPNGPAARAGLRQGDVILSVNGQQIIAPDDLVSVIEQAQPDDQVNLVLRRDDQQQELEVRLGNRSEFFGSMFRGDMMPQGFEDFGTSSIPGHAMMLEQHRRMAEQHERIENLLRELRSDIDELRQDIKQQRQNGTPRESQDDSP